VRGRRVLPPAAGPRLVPARRVGGHRGGPVDRPPRGLLRVAAADPRRGAGPGRAGRRRRPAVPVGAQRRGAAAGPGHRVGPRSTATSPTGPALTSRCTRGRRAAPTALPACARPTTTDPPPPEHPALIHLPPH